METAPITDDFQRAMEAMETGDLSDVMLSMTSEPAAPTESTSCSMTPEQDSGVSIQPDISIESCKRSKGWLLFSKAGASPVAFNAVSPDKHHAVSNAGKS